MYQLEMELEAAEMQFAESQQIREDLRARLDLVAGLASSS